MTVAIIGPSQPAISSLPSKSCRLSFASSERFERMLKLATMHARTARATEVRTLCDWVRTQPVTAMDLPVARSGRVTI